MGKEKRQAHNALQRQYYESALHKPAMQVRDTPYVQRHTDRMIGHGNLNLEHEILEVGAGLGKFSIPILRKGFRLTCNDLSSVQLVRLQAKASFPVSTVACDIIDIAKNTEQTFDRVIGFFTLHHMVEMEVVFEGIRKVLRPGAEVVFIEPMGRNPLFYLQIFLSAGMSMRAERGIVDMSDRVVHGAMRRAGLEPLPSVSYGFAPPFVVNTLWGSRMEDFLNRQAWLGWAHAFLLFRARIR